MKASGKPIDHMKAMTFHHHGGVDQLRLDEVPVPIVGPGQVLIRVKACALNYLDLWIRQGIPAYQVSLPHILGSDIAGTIEEIGPNLSDGNVDELSQGDSVIVSPGLSCWRCQWCLAGKDNLCTSFQVLGAQVDGGYAAFIVVPHVNVLPLPNGLSFERAAAFPLVSITSWHMIFELAKLQPGETVLIMAAGSGVGSMAIQLAKLGGATVITTVGSDHKIAKAKSLGADMVVNHSTDDITKKIFELTDGRGVDVVIEHIGQDVWEACMKSLARGGRLITCGATTGGDVSLNARSLFSRQVTVAGSYLGTRAELVKAAMLMESGKLFPVVDRVFPLEEAREAQEYLINRKAFGKVVLRVDEN